MPWLHHLFLKQRWRLPLLKILTHHACSLTPRLFASIVLLGVILPFSGASALADDFNPPDRGIPGRRRGGGTRNPQIECMQVSNQVLTALVPANNLGLTIAEYPQIFWFVPPHNAPLVEISLYATNTDFQDEDLLFLSQFQTSGRKGISHFKIPDTIHYPPLVEGKTYHWYVSLICDPNDRSQDVTVSGWIERVPVPASLVQTLDTLTGIDRYQALAREGLWFDALETWADLYCSQSADSEIIGSLWKNLVQDDQVKLEEFAQTDWLNTCR